MKDAPVSFEYDFDKVIAALVYFASQPPDRVTNFDKKKALNFIFLADKIHLTRYGEPIFGDYYAALPLGAVPQKTWKRLNRLESPKGRDPQRLAAALELVIKPGHKYPIIRARVAPDLDVLSELERKALDEVIELYGRKTFKELRGPVHPPAWDKARASEPLNVIAPLMRYEDVLADEPGTDDALKRMLEEFEFRRALSDPRF